jgi:hypothetical protein
MPPMPSGTRYRVKTIIKKNNEKVKVRLAFDPKTNKVLEAQKLPKRRGR